MTKPIIILFARAPRLGQVKRRLAAGIGEVPALQFYRNALARITRELRPFNAVIAVTPNNATWPNRRLPTIPQGHGNLGTRMHHTLRRYPHHPAIIIGADIPTLSATIIRQAIQTLKHHDATFGPATDGGYYLVGLARRRPTKPFANVRWSTPHALADTTRNFTHLRIALLPTLTDIDTPENLKNQPIIRHCGTTQNLAH